MTSEVLILNKRGVVIGADSAVTTSGGAQPRYSKTATKIFELSNAGQVAAAIYGNASIDLVPWELALKLYRSQLNDRQCETVEDYSADLMRFLSGNSQLFPAELRSDWIEAQFDEASKQVLEFAASQDASFRDPALSLLDRQASWSSAVGQLRNTIAGIEVPASLSPQALDSILQNLTPWVDRVAAQLAQAPLLDAVVAADVAELAHRFRYARPDLILGSSGIAIAGYGQAQIFPAFVRLRVFGHIGDEIYYLTDGDFKVTHGGTGWIQPLAQSSMIDVFTDGFGRSLESIIQEEGEKAMAAAFAAVAAAGVVIDPNLARTA